MNILAILPISIGGRLTTSSIIDGFRQNNCNVLVYDELFEDKNVLIDFFSNNKFDYILSYDYTGVHHNIENNFNLKTINYFSDLIEGPASTIAHHKYFSEIQKENNFNFYWDKQDAERLLPQFKHLYYFPHFVNTDIYYDYNYKRSCDVMFAGRLDTDLRLNNILNLCEKFKNYQIHWFAIKRHYEDALERTPQSKKQYIKKIYKGFIDNEKDMAKELNKSKIVINFHSQGKSAVNYRTFQAMACGCVVLSNLQQEMPYLFNIDDDIICYENFEVMADKLNYLLSNSQIQTKISQNAQNCIKNKYNSKLACKKIIEIISEK